MTPKIIHLIGPDTLPAWFAPNVENTRAVNPDWTVMYTGDTAALQFIRDFYGEDMLRLYLRINPEYGAARADLLRYLLVYHYGGVYMDLKVKAVRPFNKTLPQGTDLVAIDLGDNVLRQWFLAGPPSCHALSEVVPAVMGRIEGYFGRVGHAGVWDTTGPVVFTEAVSRCDGVIGMPPGKAGVEYTFVKHPTAHYGALGVHYSRLRSPIVL